MIRTLWKEGNLNICIHNLMKQLTHLNLSPFTFEWERETGLSGKGDREGDTESEAGFRLWAVSTELIAVPEPMNCEIVTWAQVGHLTDWDIQVLLISCTLKGTVLLNLFRSSINLWESDANLLRKLDTSRCDQTFLFSKYSLTSLKSPWTPGWEFLSE